MSKRNEKKHWTEKLAALCACSEAIEWARNYPTLRAAWEACERGDWMLWLAGKVCRTLPQRKRLVLAACACARTALRYVTVGEKRPRTAIRTAERWARGDRSVTLQDVRSAAAAAATAYADSFAVAAYAAYAAYAAADWQKGRTEALLRTAKLVRKHYSNAPRLKGGKDVE